jgi:ethanolamine utilization microcompartment shell protein EutL
MMREPLYSKAEEYVGSAPAHTIGLVIANVDSTLRDILKIPSEYSSLGIVSTRVGACTQIAAVDDAVKSTNTELVDFELARDSAGYGGPGVALVLGAASVYDARRAVELSLKGVEERCKTLYINEVGHMEIQTSASAGPVLNKIFGAPMNKAFGFMGIGPCGVGMVAADTCFKSAHVELVWYGRPNENTPHQNDFITIVSGDYAAIKSCTEAVYDKAANLLTALGSYPKSILEFGQS